jgi:hypothetical protein
MDSRGYGLKRGSIKAIIKIKKRADANKAL